MNRDDTRPALITGGAGFIGTNLAERLLRDGLRVIVYDDLSRPGVERNITGLRARWGDRVQIEIADVRDPSKLHASVRCASQVYHLAAQTRSSDNGGDATAIRSHPKLRAALAVLEAARSASQPPSVLFAVSHHVYEPLSESSLRQYAGRYEPHDDGIRRFGIAESRPLTHCGESGAADTNATDQAVLDRARESGVEATALRLSGTYGPHQTGNDDRLWVAHACLRAMQSRPACVRGDGMQVRDLLYIDDLVDAMVQGQRHIGSLSGRAFNVGGGTGRSVTALDVVRVIGGIHGTPVSLQFEPWRCDDTRYWVADNRAFARETGWFPRIELSDGAARTYRWMREATAAVPAKRIERGQRG